MNRKQLFRLFLGITLFFTIIYIVKFLLDYGQPNFDKELVNELISDRKIIEEIGNYKGYEFTYSRKDTQKDSLVFILKINGFEGSIQFDGVAVKNNNVWKLKRIVKR